MAGEIAPWHMLDFAVFFSRTEQICLADHFKICLTVLVTISEKKYHSEDDSRFVWSNT